MFVSGRTAARAAGSVRAGVAILETPASEALVTPPDFILEPPSSEATGRGAFDFSPHPFTSMCL